MLYVAIFNLCLSFLSHMFLRLFIFLWNIYVWHLLRQLSSKYNGILGKKWSYPSRIHACIVYWYLSPNNITTIWESTCHMSPVCRRSQKQNLGEFQHHRETGLFEDHLGEVWGSFKSSCRHHVPPVDSSRSIIPGSQDAWAAGEIWIPYAVKLYMIVVSLFLLNTWRSGWWKLGRGGGGVQYKLGFFLS